MATLWDQKPTFFRNPCRPLPLHIWAVGSYRAFPFIVVHVLRFYFWLLRFENDIGVEKCENYNMRSMLLGWSRVCYQLRRRSPMHALLCVSLRVWHQIVFVKCNLWYLDKLNGSHAAKRWKLCPISSDKWLTNSTNSVTSTVTIKLLRL